MSNQTHSSPPNPDPISGGPTDPDHYRTPDVPNPALLNQCMNADFAHIQTSV